MSVLAWVKASRLPSQSYIFLPLLLGQAIAYSVTYSFSFPMLLLAHAYGLFIQLFIVYANDFADFESDQDNHTYFIFSGGSRVLVDNIVSKRSLKKAIFLTIGLNLLLGLMLSLFFDKFLSFLFIVLSLLLLWFYSYSPVKLSYRGGGEFLQAIGLAVLLPLFGFYLQSGTLAYFPPILFFVLIPIHLSCALSTTLPDYPSDKLHNKKTLSVMINPDFVKKSVIVLNFISFTLLLTYSAIPVHTGFFIVLTPLLLSLIMIRLFKNAVTGTKSLFYFVLCNIVSTGVFNAGLAIFYFIAEGPLF